MEVTSAEGMIAPNVWVIQIRKGLEYIEDEERLELCGASVFNVPKELLESKPEAYIPQAVSIGPYHHRRSDLHEIEGYKLASARRLQRRLSGDQKFEVVVQEFQKFDWRIRIFYHKYIVYQEETLAWLMALDASFVLECLEFYVNRDAGKRLEAEFIKQFGPTFKSKGSSTVQNAIVRDMMMLENQIPLFLLEKLLEMQFDSKQKAEEKLCILANKACTTLSPFNFSLKQISTGNVKKRAHILELLYYVIVPIVPLEFDENVAEENEATPWAEAEAERETEAETIKQSIISLWTTLSSLNVGPVHHLLQFGQRIFKTKPVQLITKLPWSTLSSVLRTYRGPMCSMFSSVTQFNKDQNAEGSASQCESQEILPSPEELSIPSVSDLYYAGFKFAPTLGDLASIRFDEKTVTLYLPRIRIDTNTEVILRNLMAFEASAVPGTLVFTRYIDFMNGMIDTKEDVSLLRKSGIISSHIRSDREIADLWNSMGKCVHFSNVPQIDNVVADLNNYYRRIWSVTLKNYMNRYIFRSWKCLSLLAAVLLLVFTCLEAFCSVYDCRSWLSNARLVND